MLIEKEEKTGKLKLNESGLEQLNQIEEPLAVCLIAGPYRSGKSFLMSKIVDKIASKNEAMTFQVGHLDQSNTKGIWLSQSFLVRNEQGNPVRMIFMDTEVFNIKN